MHKNKTIWMCWFQGEDHKSLCGLNRKCVNRWKELNPKWEVNVLSDSSIIDYVPEFYSIIAESPRRSSAAKSDLLRLLLLSKFGGVWADASVYPMLPLSDFYENIMNDTGFFTYRFAPRSKGKKGNRETVSWFLCVDRPNHYLIEKWKTRYIDKFKNSKHWKYYTIHHTLVFLYDSDEKVKKVIDNMIQISQEIPHSALKDGWDDKKTSYMYKRPFRKNMQKTSATL